LIPLLEYGSGGMASPGTYVSLHLDLKLNADRHPGQAKREPGSQKERRFDPLRSRIRLRLSGMTAAVNGGRSKGRC